MSEVFPTLAFFIFHFLGGGRWMRLATKVITQIPFQNPKHEYYRCVCVFCVCVRFLKCLAESVIPSPGKMAPPVCCRILRQAVILFLLHSSFWVNGNSQEPEVGSRYGAHPSNDPNENNSNDYSIMSGPGDSESDRTSSGKHTLDQIWH